MHPGSQRPAGPSIRRLTYPVLVTTVASAKVERLLSLVADVHDHDGPAPFTTVLLDGVKDVLPADVVSFSEIDHSRQSCIAQAECSASPCDVSDEPLPGFWEWCWGHPLSVRRRRTGEREPVKLSDLGRRERLEERARASAYRTDGVEDELWIDLSPSHVHTRKILVGRCGAGFGEGDRRVASLLQPHFAAACRNAARRRLLTAALAATDAARHAVVFLGADGEIEFVSAAAHDLLEEFFGGNGRLPKPLADWHRSRRSSPFLVHRGERCLVVEPAGSWDTLLVREETAPAALTLTSREHDVVLLVAAGKSNKEIARDLWVTPATVKKHLEHVYKKLGVGSRTAAVARLALTPSA